MNESNRGFVRDDDGVVCGYQCKAKTIDGICGELFPTSKGVNLHLKRVHKINVQDVLDFDSENENVELQEAQTR